MAETYTPHPGRTPTAPHLHDTRGKELRFLEALQTALAGCRTEADVYSTAVQRVAAALPVASCLVALYDPVAQALDVVRHGGAKRDWPRDVLMRAVEMQRTVTEGAILAVPLLAADGQAGGTDGAAWPRGILAVARDVEHAPFSAGDRQTVRGAAVRLTGELERRRLLLLDDALDGLLRKTKPIDVYTHALRELRRFIRYDHSASIMTMGRGVAQVTVRVEKVVRQRGEGQTLADSLRRGRGLRLTPAQARYLDRLGGPIVLANAGAGWRIHNGHDDPDAAGLWRVLRLGGAPEEAEGAILCYPLVFGGQMLGLLRLAARRTGAFDGLERHTRLLDRFARLLAVTLYRSEVYHQSDRQLQAIKEIGRIITRPLPVEEICSGVLQLALRVLHVEVGVVGLLGEAGRLELVAHHGCSLAQLPTLAVGEGISGTVVQTGVSTAVPDVTAEPAYVVFNGRVRSELVAPITYDREVIGFLNIESFEEGRFREEDEEVITFLEALANQAAIAIKAAQLRSEAMKSLGPSMAIDPKLSMAGLQDLLIDELRHKNEQLAATNERLAAANRSKSEFLAHMSHDLRGPLNVIVGLSELLGDPTVAATLDEEKRRESLELIRCNGEVLSALIGNILDLSAVEAGKVQLDAAPFAAAPAFEYLSAVARTLAAEAGKAIDVYVDVAPAITAIVADEDKFLRIMTNLISNAVKFTPSGGRIAITVAAEPDSAARRRCLHIAVTDTGSGIAPEDHERIFEPFQQIPDAVYRQRHGTGLGLAVVRQFVDLHGGHVYVESALGQGSTFHVVLPGALEPAPAGVPSLDTPGVTEPTAPQDARAALRILVVEDTPAHVEVMRLALASRGHDVHSAGRGDEALALIAAHRPDVVLLDMQLPDLDGFSIAERLKRQVETHTIPIIAVTADALSVTEERALASGCDAYLTKPIDVARLLETIDRVTRWPLS